MNGSPTGTFSQAPWQLNLFALFSSAVAVLGILMLLPGMRELVELLMPIWGWNASGAYLFCAFMSIYLIHHRTPQMLKGLVWILGIYAGLGVVWLFVPRPDTQNIYLIVSPLRPLWTILVPVFWIVALRSRTVRDYAGA